MVILKPGQEATEADLIEHCRGHLAGYETPKGIVFSDFLPETVGGKVLKYKLRAQHADHFTSGQETGRSA